MTDIILRNPGDDDTARIMLRLAYDFIAEFPDRIGFRNFVVFQMKDGRSYIAYRSSAKVVVVRRNVPTTNTLPPPQGNPPVDAGKETA